MELVVITALAVVIVILQIIILANQQKNAKLIREFIAERPKPHSRHDRERPNNRRDGNFNRNQRGGSPNNNSKSGPKQATTASANVDSVEKSLRDINLKLKNAERDQDAARRKINDVIGGEAQSQRPQRSNRDGGNRGNKGRDRGGRNNFRNRGDSDRNFNRGQSQENSHPAATTDADANLKPSVDAVGVIEPAVLPELKPVDFEADQEHGRKFAVKRRVLQDEGTSGAGQAENSDVSKNENDGSNKGAMTHEASVDSTSTGDGEISFGRR